MCHQWVIGSLRASMHTVLLMSVRPGTLLSTCPRNVVYLILQWVCTSPPPLELRFPNPIPNMLPEDILTYLSRPIVDRYQHVPPIDKDTISVYAMGKRERE